MNDEKSVTRAWMQNYTPAHTSIIVSSLYYYDNIIVISQNYMR